MLLIDSNTTSIAITTGMPTNEQLVIGNFSDAATHDAVKKIRKLITPSFQFHHIKPSNLKQLCKGTQQSIE